MLFVNFLPAKTLKLDINTTWHWQLDKEINLNHDAKVYIIDLFDTKKETIQKLHDKKKIVIAYFSAGSYEKWREDSSKFLKKDLGKKMSGWDEKWVDVRSKNVFKIMQKRMILAKQKGFDGIEADNVDGYINDTGFALTYNDQLKFNKSLAIYAHQIGLIIALKNDVDQIEQLERYFDFAINESCHKYNECERYKPFINSNKPVFNAEYQYKNIEKICKISKKLQINTQFLPLGLDGTIIHDCNAR